MQRGQAFETMMLVISVIVALAILAVLMGILGNLGTQFGSDPKTVIHDGLREIVSKGYGIGAAKKATFEKGAIILKKDIIGSDVPLPDTDLKLFVQYGLVRVNGSAKIPVVCGSGVALGSTNTDKDTTSITGSDAVFTDPRTAIYPKDIHVCAKTEA